MSRILQIVMSITCVTSLLLCPFNLGAEEALDPKYADNEFYQSCLKHSISRYHDCACIVDNQTAARQYVSDNRKVDSMDSPTVKRHLNTIAEYETLIEQTDNEGRIMQYQRKIAIAQERIKSRTTKPALETISNNAIFKYFQTDVNIRPQTCRSRQKAYDWAIQQCRKNQARSDSDQAEKYCNCMTEDTVERWMNPTRSRETLNLGAAAKKCMSLRPKK